jgi:hypothetical protein
MVALTTVITRSIDEARSSAAGYHAAHVVRSGALQQTVVALTEGTRLAEHESEVPASVNIQHGAIRGEGAEPFVIEQGALHELPPLRRGVVAVEDTVMLLSASTAGADGGEYPLHEYVLAPE